MISLLGFSLRVDGGSDVSCSSFKDWWTRLSGRYVFCKHLGAASTCGTDKLPVGGVVLVVLFWEGHDITREGIVHPNIQIYDRVSFNLM